MKWVATLQHHLEPNFTYSIPFPIIPSGALKVGAEIKQNTLMINSHLTKGIAHTKMFCCLQDLQLNKTQKK
jgi:hypothetical protein